MERGNTAADVAAVSQGQATSTVLVQQGKRDPRCSPASSTMDFVRKSVSSYVFEPVHGCITACKVTRRNWLGFKAEE